MLGQIRRTEELVLSVSINNSEALLYLAAVRRCFRRLVALSQLPVNQCRTRRGSPSFPVCLLRSGRNCARHHCASREFQRAETVHSCLKLFYRFIHGDRPYLMAPTDLQVWKADRLEHLTSVSCPQILLFLLSWTMIVLASAADLRYDNAYHDVLRTTCGPNAQRLAAVSVLVACYGVSVSFFVIIGDQFDRREQSQWTPQIIH